MQQRKPPAPSTDPTRMASKNGRFSRLTATEIERVRGAYRRYYDALRERKAICDELRLKASKFYLIGTGQHGKKPRPEV